LMMASRMVRRCQFALIEFVNCVLPIFEAIL
jgi:hypothetical protein